ncbi:MAG: methyltransferase domain-containing protein [bacterium]|nr:methyltransferase domain-containing protein [bacterium]
MQNDVPNSMRDRFPDTPYPRVNAIFRAGERIRRRQYGVSRAFPEVDGPEFWYWLMWYGPAIFHEIQAVNYAFPGEGLRARVIGENASWKRFNQGGLVDWRRIERCLREAGMNFRGGGAVLDFGCGCGRILRHFALYAGRGRFYGTDLDAEAVGWCDLHLDFAACSAGPAAPPLDFSDGFFEAVYAYSVFSHLPEEASRAWLAELARLLKPGGLAALTVQGRAVAEAVLSGAANLGVPSRETLRGGLARLEESGFLFYPYQALGETDARELDPARYGNAFILKPYIERRWTEAFDLADYLPAPDGWQDYVILKRR